MNLFFIIILILISFIPILIWAYSFAYISENPLNKKRFFVGILGGILSVFPILYLGNFSSGFGYFNIFYFLREISDFFSSLKFGFSLGLFLFFLVIFSFIFGFLIIRKKKIFKIYLKNFFSFLIFVFIFSFFIFGLNLVLDNFDFEIKNKIEFGNVIFGSLKLIIFYYLVVAFIEESSKHFNFLQSSIFSIKSVKSGVESAIFVALGFAFIENILYLYNFFEKYGLNFELVKIYFFRSIFSVVVHIFCSSIMAYYFSKAYLIFKEKNLNFPYFKIFSIGIFFSIFIHLIFNISVIFGLNIFLFIYFIVGYLYISSIFYKK